MTTLRCQHTMPFGARLLEHGGAEFRLWAPGAPSVELVLTRPGGAQRHAAQAGAGGWHAVSVADASAGERYQWAIPQPQGEVLVPDPASRSNPDGVHAPSAVVDAQAFAWDDDWTGRPWHQSVVYELHIGAFTAEGSFAAARERLPALAQAGITALQVMPLSSFGGRFGWGYDGVLPYAPHAAYGSPDDFKAFVQAAHRLGLMVMLDVVYNHFGPDGNYLGLYAPQFFSERHHTPWGAAINFDGEHSATVREFFIHNALYWLHEYQLDGLRFDAVHAMLDDSACDIMEEISLRARRHCTGRHIHLVLENDTNDAARLAPPGTRGRFDAQWNGDFHHTVHVLLTHEHDGYYGEYAEQPLAQLARCLTDGYAREGAPHLDDEAGRQKNPRRAASSTVPLSTTLNFLSNHDQIGNRAFGERLAQLVPEAPARLALAVLLLNPAPPMLFMGEEFGAATPFLYFADWQGDLRTAVTEGRRREFAQFPRFADPAVREHIPDPCSADTFERSKLDWPSFEGEPSKRWHAFTCELLALRRQHLWPLLPGLVTCGHEAELIGPTALRVRWRFASRLLEMTANLGPQPLALEQPAAAASGLGEDVFRLGEIDEARCGAWSGRWRWLALPA